MKVLVDTSVWSLALRRRQGTAYPEAAALRRLIERAEDICLLGIILQEVLQGIKNPADFKLLNNYLTAFPLIELARDDYVRAAELKNRLTGKGIQAGTTDVLIASSAIAHKCRLFTADRDFDHIAKHSDLQLFKH